MSGRGRTRRLVLRLVASVVTLGLTGCASASRHERGAGSELTIAAASDLRPVFEQLGERFERDTGIRVTFTFGSSGHLKQQITQGAPFDVFASANTAFVDELVSAGHARAESKATFALGSLVVWSAKAGRSIEQLGDPSLRIIAIANPDHAPYGLAARQALQNVGLWEDVQPRVVFGENVADTLRLATSGNADAAIVAQSLALVNGTGHASPVDPALYDPLVQTIVTVGATAPAAPAAGSAQQFIDLVLSDTGRSALKTFGFSVPE